MGKALQDRRVLVIGRASGIARAITLLARSEGAEVVVAGRDREKLAATYDDPGVTAKTLEVADDASIAELARRIGTLDHVVSTASARARGALAEVNRANLLQALGTKVLGPTMLAKYFAPHMSSSGSFVLLSGANAVKGNVGCVSVAIANGAVNFLTRSLAVELAPIRVNAILQGRVDVGVSHPFGVDGERTFFDHVDFSHPAGRYDTVDCVARAVLFAMTNKFMTGVMLNVADDESLV